MNIRRFSLCAARVFLVMGAVAVSSLIVRAGSAEEERQADCECKSPQPHGTLIRWNSDMAAAAERARKESKLLLVLHLSGNFEKEEFT